MKPELLSPAGDFEKLTVAIKYGADAVYLGGEFSLRTHAGFDEISYAIEYAHEHNVKVYVTVNIFAHDEQLERITKYLPKLSLADAVIVSDVGVFDLVKSILPHVPIHISTQANTLNHSAVEFWNRNGAKRIILARELSLNEITTLNKKCNVQTEMFVHGAMCVAYSGRCLLSNYLKSRDANQGDCAQPCRWKFNVSTDDVLLSLEEDANGTFILNSKDLCLINHLREVINTGVCSLKIEGRMKSAYYVGAVTKVYREALDDYFTDPSLYHSKHGYYMTELEKVSHRCYSTGFCFGNAEQVYSTGSYIQTYDFIGIVKEYDKNTKLALIEQRNKFSVGEAIEVLTTSSNITMKIEQMFDDENNTITSAPHAQQLIKMKMPEPVEPLDMLRRIR